ncbi:MAG: hypothetical protein WCA89_15250 [Terracidiphilus sp.]
MDLNRLRALLAVPMASLFLVLVLCVFGVQRPPSVGIHLPMTKVQPITSNSCFDERDIVIIINKDGSTKINETPVQPEKLDSIISKIFQYRHEGRVVYVIPDPDVSFREFADIYNKIASSTDNLHIGLMTRQLKTQLEQCPEGSICGFEWPDHGYTHSCLYFNSRPVPIPHHPLR